MTRRITVEEAERMGAKGAPINEHERLLFEEWMSSEGWSIDATWTGKEYLSPRENKNFLDRNAMMTRQLWAAWRDRAGLEIQIEKEGFIVAPSDENEHLLFEAWMKGHCWAICSTWNGNNFVGENESEEDTDPQAMWTRMLWSAWLTRAKIQHAKGERN